MATKIESYERLKEHIPDEAARLIAEEVPVEAKLVTQEHFDLEMERLRSSLFRWNLTFFLPLWIGVYGTLIAVLLRG